MKCVTCQKEFAPKKPQQSYCSAKCLRDRSKRLMRARIQDHQAKKK